MRRLLSVVSCCFQCDGSLRKQDIPLVAYRLPRVTYTALKLIIKPF